MSLNHRVVAIGWHCFSSNCKHTTPSPEYGCKKETNKSGKCLMQECPVFKNAKDVPNEH